MVTALVPEAGAPAPASPAKELADVNELFPKRAPKRQEILLPDLGKRVLFQALSPKDYDEVNHAAVTHDGGKAQLDNRLWNARLIARAMRSPTGARAWNDEMGWRGLAERIADFWTIADVQVAAEGVADLSGISAKARKALEEALGKDSNGTETSG